MKGHITKKEERLLRDIREDYSKDRCIQIWNDVRNGFLKKHPNGFWKKHNHREYIVETFVEEYKENNIGKYPRAQDFHKNKLLGLLGGTYSDSPFLALQEAGFMDKDSENYDPILDETPWLALDNVPLSYWKKDENIKKAVNWLAEKTNKDVTEIESVDFEKNRMNGLTCAFGSIIDIIRKAGYVIDEIDRNVVPNNYWDKEENRIKHTIQLVEGLGKDPTEITQKDFKNNGLAGLLGNMGSHIEALKEAGYEFDVLGFHQVPPNYWTKKENRVKHTKELVENLGKPFNEIVRQDFEDNRLGGLLDKTNESHFKALEEAGYEFDVLDLKRVPKNYWNKKVNRIKHTIQLVEKLGKPVTEITASNFKNNRLSRLLKKMDDSVYRILIEAGYEFELEDMKRLPRGFWKKKENRVKAIKSHVEELGKAIEEIRRSDFEGKIIGMIRHYHDGHYKDALREAGFLGGDLNPACY